MSCGNVHLFLFLRIFARKHFNEEFLIELKKKKKKLQRYSMHCEAFIYHNYHLMLRCDNVRFWPMTFSSEQNACFDAHIHEQSWYSDCKNGISFNEFGAKKDNKANESFFLSQEALWNHHYKMLRIVALKVCLFVCSFLSSFRMSRFEYFFFLFHEIDKL